MKKLTRSSSNKMICGVCGGVGEYFSVDPTVVRVVSAIATVCTGILPGAIVYGVAAVIMPEG